MIRLHFSVWLRPVDLNDAEHDSERPLSFFMDTSILASWLREEYKTIRMAAKPVVAPSPVWIVIVLRGPISAAFAGWLVG